MDEQPKAKDNFLSRVKQMFLPTGGKKGATVSGKGLVGITISHGMISIAHVQGEELENLAVKSLGYEKAKTIEQQQEFLKSFVEKNKLHNYPVNFVLAAKDYSLTMLEPPEVEPGEMREALRWGIKDYVDFSPEEAAIDAIPLPFKRASDNKDLSYVVVMKDTLVQEIENLISSVGLKLKYIDIPGLALRNIAGLYPDCHKGCLILRLKAQGGYSAIVRDGNLIQLRTIDSQLNHFIEGQHEISVEQAITEPQIDTFTLEVQRTMDYCRSLFRQLPVNSIILTPSELDNALIAECLKQNIGLPVECLELKKYISFEKSVSDSDVRYCLTAIGGGLRHVNFERPQHAATN